MACRAVAREVLPEEVGPERARRRGRRRGGGGSWEAVGVGRVSGGEEEGAGVGFGG